MLGVLGATSGQKVPLLQEGVRRVEVLVIGFGSFEKFLRGHRLDPATSGVTHS